MTDTPTTTSTDQAETRTRGRYQSARGGFEIFRSPPLRPPMQYADVPDHVAQRGAAGIDISRLIDHGASADDVRTAVADMVHATIPGTILLHLFNQPGPTGMSLSYLWFGPRFPLFRHSHPSLGDCLYFVMSGSLILGSQEMTPGDGFFVPSGMAYKYKAGPDGLEILEFRVGDGEGTSRTVMNEPSVAAIETLTNTARSLHAQWATPPSRVGGLGR